MLLAIDIGNSNVVVGLWLEGQWVYSFRLESNQSYEPRDVEMHIRDFFLEHDIHLNEIKRSVLCSVVPALTPIVQAALERLLGTKPLMVGPSLYGRLAIHVNNPAEMGADLVANASAAYDHFKATCLVVDFGTALTVTTVGAEGHILGVAIAPGIQTAMKALAGNTAKLPEIPLKVPTSVLGKNTIHAMQAGILLGYEGLVKALVSKTEAEIGQPAMKLATGGLAHTMAGLSDYFDAIMPMLTLDGLIVIDRQFRAKS